MKEIKLEISKEPTSMEMKFCDMDELPERIFIIQKDGIENIVFYKFES